MRGDGQETVQDALHVVEPMQREFADAKLAERITAPRVEGDAFFVFTNRVLPTPLPTVDRAAIKEDVGAVGQRARGEVEFPQRARVVVEVVNVNGAGEMHLARVRLEPDGLRQRVLGKGQSRRCRVEIVPVCLLVNADEQGQSF